MTTSKCAALDGGTTAKRARAKRADALHRFGESKTGERLDAQAVAAAIGRHRGARIGDEIGDGRRQDIVDAAGRPRQSRIVAEIALAKRRREGERDEAAADLARADGDLAALGMKGDAEGFEPHRRRPRPVVTRLRLDRAEQQADDVGRIAEHQVVRLGPHEIPGDGARRSVGPRIAQMTARHFRRTVTRLPGSQVQHGARSPPQATDFGVRSMCEGHRRFVYASDSRRLHAFLLAAGIAGAAAARQNVRIVNICSLCEHVT